MSFSFGSAGTGGGTGGGFSFGSTGEKGGKLDRQDGDLIKVILYEPMSHLCAVIMMI